MISRTDPAKEVGQSQVFLAIAPASVETIEELSRFAQGAERGAEGDRCAACGDADPAGEAGALSR